MTFSRPLYAMVLFATLGLQSRAAAQAPLGPTSASAPPLTPTATTRRLDLNVAISSGYELIMAEDTRPGLPYDPRFAIDAASSGVTGTLAFSRHSRSMDFGLSGGGNLQHYSSVPKLLPINYHGGGSLSARIGERTQMRVGGGGSYSPYYSFGDFLAPRSDTIAAPRAELNVLRLATYTGSSSFGLSTLLTRKLSFNAGANGDVVTTSNTAYRMYGIGSNAGLSYRTTRYSQFRAGYGYRRSLNGTDSIAFEIHNIDTGFSYSRPLSFSRRTSVSANTGSAVVAYAGGHSFAVVGNGSLAHQLTQRSAVSVSYARDISMFAGITRPYTTDSVTTSLAGVLTRDLSYSIGGGYSMGRAMIDINNGYSLASGSGRLQYRLTRFIPVFVEYSYFNYRFERPSGLEDGFPLLSQRHGLRGGLSYSVPVIGRRVP